MSLIECFTFLLLGISVIATAMNLLNTNSNIEEINKQIGYLFDWISEVENKLDRLDKDIQKLQK